MTLIRSSLCRLRPMFNQALQQTRSHHGPDIYGPPKVRASFTEKCVLGAIYMTIIVGPSAYLLRRTAVLRGQRT